MEDRGEGEDEHEDERTDLVTLPRAERKRRLWRVFPSRWSLETVTSLAGQSRDDNRSTAVCSSTAVNLLADGNMIARRVLRDRGTPRNTVGTYEYNPVDRERGGWRSEARLGEESGGEERSSQRSARCRCPMFPIRTKFDVPPAKIRGAGYESLSTPVRDNNRP